MATEAVQRHSGSTVQHPAGSDDAGSFLASAATLITPEGKVQGGLDDLRRQLTECKETIAYIKKAASADGKTALEMVPIQSTRVYNTIGLYKMLVNEHVRDMALESHREIKLEKAICQICNTSCNDYVSAPALDIFGNSPTETEQFPCENCGSMQTSSRYAPHLEKCMGLSSRGPGRPARHRGPILARSVSPYILSDDKEVSSDYADSDDKEWSNGEGQKRKRVVGDSDDKEWGTGEGKKRKKMPKMPAIKIKKSSAQDTPAATSAPANPVVT